MVACLSSLSIIIDEEFAEIIVSKSLSMYASICQEYAENLASLIHIEDEKHVTWLEIDEVNDYFCLKRSPLEVGPSLYNLIYESKNCVIFTSATLTINNKFDFFIKQTGLDRFPDEKLRTVIIPASYNYDSQALLCIADNLPLPIEIEEDDYVRAIGPAIFEMVKANQGRALVLFTSHRLLKLTYRFLKGDLDKEGIVLLGQQVDGDRSFLIEEFKRQNKAVIFGANSFWEGIDIPGEDLTLIIIVKLPFQSPSVPIIAAKIALCRSQGLDPFQLLNLPQAVIKFKQGFGRLIRTTSDRGMIVILDPRIINKSYGKYFLNSIPLKTHVRGSVEEISKLIAINQAN